MLSLSIPLHTSCPREFWSPTTCLNSDLHLTSPHTPTQGQYMARDQQPLKTCPHVRTKVKLLMPSLICQSPLQPPAELEELSLVYRYRMWRHAHASRSRWRNSCVLIDDERNGGRYIVLPHVSYWWCGGCSTHKHYILWHRNSEYSRNFMFWSLLKFVDIRILVNVREQPQTLHTKT